MNRPDQVIDLLNIIEQLSDLLERENDMLRTMKPFEIQTLQEDKLALTAAYEARLKSLKENPEEVNGWPVSARTGLKETIRRFQAMLANNEHSLRAARQATERTLTAIAEEVRLRTQEHAAYSDKGAALNPTDTTRMPAVSLAFDQRF
jgi:hypothetical protein